MDFTNKRILVTGATKGIGRAITDGLIAHGAHVVAIGRDNADLESLKKTVTFSIVKSKLQIAFQHDGKVSALRVDITGDEATIAAALQPFQPFDGVVNNAGVAILETVTELTLEAIRKQFEVNVFAPLIICKITTREMIAHNIKGSIVQISSQASQITMDKHTVYCLHCKIPYFKYRSFAGATKAALDHSTRQMATELGPHGIRINCINPNVVWTEMSAKNWSDPVKRETLINRTPLRRFTEPREVVDAVMFLLSDMSSHTTGAQLPVDGGTMCV